MSDLWPNDPHAVNNVNMYAAKIIFLEYDGDLISYRYQTHVP